MWTVSDGDIGFTLRYDPVALTLEVIPDDPVEIGRVTIVLDYSIADEFGNALDGETFTPLLPRLPSGDGVPGGQAVFRINVLGGDATRDGLVDDADALAIRDALGSGIGDSNYNPFADLNSDGWVNVLDVGIFIHGEGSGPSPS